MGLAVPRLTRNYLNKRNIPEAPERTVQLSVELSDEQLAKLRFLAGRFEAPEASVIRDLLDAAMDDALNTLGAFDTMSYEETQTIPMEQQLEIVDRQVEQYQDEIQRTRDS